MDRSSQSGRYKECCSAAADDDSDVRGPSLPQYNRLIMDEDGKPRGYAFIEYEREQDMRTAYKRADGK